MKITDILAKTFQICWVTNDLDKAVEHFKVKYDVDRFLIMEDVPFTEVKFRGDIVDKGEVRAAWVSAGHINLELVEPRAGFTLDLYGNDIQGSDFKIAFHHIGVRFDDDLEGYKSAVKAMQDKGFETTVESGIDGMSEFAYFDARSDLGHYIELIYFNRDGVAFMKTIEEDTF